MVRSHLLGAGHLARIAMLVPASLLIALSIVAAETSPRTKPATTSAAGGAWGLREVLLRQPGQPRVLLIGDSILNGYHGSAAALLRGKVGLDVWVTPKHVADKSVPKDLETIFAAHAYDVVLFNDIGLHAWAPGRIPEGQYEPLLRAHVATLQRLAPKAKLIFATTTPMTTKSSPIALDAEFNPLIAERNGIAKRVMAEAGVPVVDFYAVVVDKLDLAAGDRFHWKRPAYELLARAAVGSIAEALGLPGTDAKSLAK